MILIVLTCHSPDGHDETVEGKYWAGEIDGAPDHQLKGESHDGWEDQRVAVVGHEHVIQGDLLSKVLLDIVKSDGPWQRPPRSDLSLHLICDDTVVQRIASQNLLQMPHLRDH